MTTEKKCVILKITKGFAGFENTKGEKMILNIAIIEDEQAACAALKEQISEYGKRNAGYEFHVTHYSNPLEFLKKTDGGYDLIFLDIQMPELSGMETARRIRRKDDNVMIVFVTNMAQYALESYEVHAYDFILKPVDYDSFALKFARCLNSLSHKLIKKEIVLVSGTVKRIAEVGDITYIEANNHNVVVHFADDEFRMRGTMRGMENELRGCHFAYCNACYLVNLKWVKELKGDLVVVHKSELRISHLKKPAFLSEFARYIGGTV